MTFETKDSGYSLAPCLSQLRLTGEKLRETGNRLRANGRDLIFGVRNAVVRLLQSARTAVGQMRSAFLSTFKSGMNYVRELRHAKVSMADVIVLVVPLVVFVVFVQPWRGAPAPPAPIETPVAEEFPPIPVQPRQEMLAFAGEAGYGAHLVSLDVVTPASFEVALNVAVKEIPQNVATAAAGKKARVKSLDDTRQARLLRSGQPNYPITAEREGIEGTLLVKFDVNPEGLVENARIVEATDNRAQEALSGSALMAASRAVYSPAVRKGKAVWSKGLTQRYTFNVEGRGWFLFRSKHGHVQVADSGGPTPQ
jgi:TonB family protein